MRVGDAPSAALRLAVAGLFATIPRARYDIEVRGLEFDPDLPRTYYILAHKRDLDSIAPLPALLGHRGWRALAHDVRFTMREDAYLPGFLGRVVERPRALCWALRQVPLAPVLRLLGIEPMHGLRYRHPQAWFYEWLQAAGDVPMGEVLAPAYVARVAHATHDDPVVLARQPISRLVTWRYQLALGPECGLEIFFGRARRAMQRRTAAAVRDELATQAAWLASGGSLLGAPEGRLSADGALGPIGAGLHRLLRQAPADTRVVPVYVMYDFMTTRRTRIMVDVAPSINDGGALSRRALDTAIRTGWLRAARFTCTQLASGELAARAATGQPFTTTALASAIRAQAIALAQAGRHVDTCLLDARAVHTRVRAYLAYAARRHLVRHLARDTWLPRASADSREAHGTVPAYARVPLAYALCELDDLLSLNEAPVTPAAAPGTLARARPWVNPAATDASRWQA